jgi:ParB/RepB/Spo0J family partition protein
MCKPRETEAIAVESIQINSRHRHAHDDAVDTLAASMRAIGLRTPITVRLMDTTDYDGVVTEGVPVLVTGATRLRAAKKLGWQKIECFVSDVDEIEARRWEIAENLHRAELTVQERADHIAEWVRLTDEKQSSQVATKGLGHRPRGGINDAAREIGVDKDAAHRAVKIAGISPEAKEAAKQAGLDDNQSALLKVARERTPAAQVAKVQQIVAPEPLDDFEATEKQLAALTSAWNRAGVEARRLFLERIDTPVFDNTRAA